MDAAYMTYREMKIAKNKIRRERIVKRQRIALAAIVAVIIFTGCFIAATLMLHAHSEDMSYKYYTSITVESGDTLSSIADKYITGEYKDTRQYINEVCAINHLDEDGTIYAGENIIIPYYSEEFK